MDDPWKCILPKVIQQGIVKYQGTMEVLSKLVVSNSNSQMFEKTDFWVWQMCDQILVLPFISLPLKFLEL